MKPPNKCSAANPAIVVGLQAYPLAGRVAELGSLCQTSRCLIVLALLAWGANAAWPHLAAADAPQAPDTPAGRALAGWLRAFNTGQVEVVRRFVQDHYDVGTIKASGGVEACLAVFNRAYGDNATLDLIRLEKSDPHEVVAMVRSPAAESWLRLTVKVLPEAPHAITEASIYFAESPPGAISRGRLENAEIVTELGAYLNKLAAADLFSGAVLLAKDGQPLFRQAYGLACRAHDAPNRVDTKFNVGSMNKMFTAVAILQLAQREKLKLDDLLIKHLPDYPNREVATNVTLHQLLTHTSGLGSYFNEDYMRASKDRFRAVADYFPLFAKDPLAFEPGARFRYSNAGFMLLGAVVERVSGQSYFDYVRENVYGPAGMTNTDAYELDYDTPNLAIGYTKEVPVSGKLGALKKNNRYLHGVKGGPAGGGFATVEDLLRFDTALRNNTLLDENHTRFLLAGKVEMSPGRTTAKYAYGFSDETIRGTRIVGHSGGFSGINGQLDIYLDRGFTFAVLSNYDPPAAKRVVNKLRDLLTPE